MSFEYFRKDNLSDRNFKQQEELENEYVGSYQGTGTQ